MKPTLKDFITTAVNYEFKDPQTRLEAKAYILRLTKNLTFEEVGLILGVCRKEASRLVRSIELRKQSKSDDRLITELNKRFNVIEESCKNYATRLTIEKGIRILEAPTAKLKAKRLELINEINWN